MDWYNEPLTKEEMALLEIKEAPKTSITESIIQGAGQGLTAGWSDEALAGMDYIVQKIFSSDKADFKQTLQKYRDAITAAKEAHPTAFKTSEFAGGVFGAFAGGAALKGAGAALKAIGVGSKVTGAAAQGVQVAGRAAETYTKAAGVGAGFGAATAAGTAENVAENPEEAALEIGMGAVGGAVLGAGLKGFVNLAGVGKRLTTLTQEFSAGTAGVGGAKGLKLGGIERIRKIGQALQDEGLTTRVQTESGLYDSILATKKAVGSALEKAYKNVSEIGKLADEKVVTTLKDITDWIALAKNKDGGALIEGGLQKLVTKDIISISSKIQKPGKEGFGLMDTWKFTQAIEDKIGKYAKGQSFAGKAEGLYEVSNGLRDAMDHYVKAVAPTKATSIKKISEIYRNFSGAELGITAQRAQNVGMRSRNPLMSTLQSTGVRTAVHGAAKNITKIGKFTGISPAIKIAGAVAKPESVRGAAAIYQGLGSQSNEEER